MDNNFKSTKEDDLVSMISEDLLIELFNKKQAEVFENVVFEGKRRYYIEDLSQRDYYLENTTPYQLEIAGYIFNEHAWGNLLSKVANYLLTSFPEYLPSIFEFKCDWSKQSIFSPDEKTNYKLACDGIFINVNYTALHSCWLLQDLLNYFKIDFSSITFLIHRPSSAEPQHVKEYVEKRFKRNFIAFIVETYNKSNEYAEEKVVHIIEKYLTPILKSISKSYDNFFLFDDKATLSNYVKKVREQIQYSSRFDEKAKKVLNRYLDYLVSYYKK